MVELELSSLVCFELIQIHLMWMQLPKFRCLQYDISIRTSKSRLVMQSLDGNRHIYNGIHEILKCVFKTCRVNHIAKLPVFLHS